MNAQKMSMEIKRSTKNVDPLLEVAPLVDTYSTESIEVALRKTPPISVTLQRSRETSPGASSHFINRAAVQASNKKE